jgi:hypothetical protein
MGERFGYDFGSVRIHTDTRAADSARAVDAEAYTVGPHVVFGAGRYQPDSPGGRRLLAHELAHVIQQPATPTPSESLGISDPSDASEREAAANAADHASHAAEPEASVGHVVMRQLTGEEMGGGGFTDPDLAAERQYGSGPAPKAQSCGRPPWCPPGFCEPYRSQQLAEYYRAKNAWWLLGGIAVAVDSRVVPLWREHLFGGSPPKNLSATFGADFTLSPTTRATTAYLLRELRSRLLAQPPFIAPSSTLTLDLNTLIPNAIAEIGDPISPNQMNFGVPRDVAGNLAGGIGTDQTACPAGALPSPFNDARLARGTVTLTRGTGREVMVTVAITYTVRDTIDLCPGDCGTTVEQLATVPISQFEATGISGDVPFTAEFPAPAQPPFFIHAPEGPVPPPSVKPSPPAKP